MFLIIDMYSLAISQSQVWPLVRLTDYQVAEAISRYFPGNDHLAIHHLMFKRVFTCSRSKFLMGNG